MRKTHVKAFPMFALALAFGVAGCHKNPTQDQTQNAAQVTDDSQDPAMQANLAPADDDARLHRNIVRPEHPEIHFSGSNFQEQASPSQGSPVKAVSARYFILRDREFVAFTRPDHELAPAAVGDLAGNRIVEEAVFQAIDDERLEPVKGLADLPVLGPLERRLVCGSPIVQ